MSVGLGDEFASDAPQLNSITERALLKHDHHAPTSFLAADIVHVLRLIVTARGRTIQYSSKLIYSICNGLFGAEINCEFHCHCNSCKDNDTNRAELQHKRCHERSTRPTVQKLSGLIPINSSANCGLGFQWQRRRYHW